MIMKGKCNEKTADQKINFIDFFIIISNLYEFSITLCYY